MKRETKRKVKREVQRNMKRKVLLVGSYLLPLQVVDICAFLNVYAPRTRRKLPSAACKSKVLLCATDEESSAEYLPPLPPLDAYNLINGDGDDDDDFTSIDAPWDTAVLPNTNGSTNTNTVVNTEVVDQITQQREQIQNLMQMVQKQSDSISRMQHKANEKSTLGSVPVACKFLSSCEMYYV